MDDIALFRMHDYLILVSFTVQLHKEMQLLGIQREYILFHLHMLSNENCTGRRGRQIIAGNECKTKIILRPEMALRGYCLTNNNNQDGKRTAVELKRMCYA